MKVLLSLAMAVGLVSMMTATASASEYRVVNVCNGGYCRTVVHDDTGGVLVSDLWKQK